MANIGIIFSTDALSWSDHLKAILEEINENNAAKIKGIQQFTTTKVVKPRSKVRNFFNDLSCVTVIIGSPGLLQYLEDNADATLGRITPEPSRVVFFCCGVQKEEVLASSLDRKMPGFKKWTITDSMDENGYIQAILSVIKLVPDGVIAETVNDGAPPPRRTRGRRASTDNRAAAVPDATAADVSGSSQAVQEDIKPPPSLSATPMPNPTPIGGGGRESGGGVGGGALPEIVPKKEGPSGIGKEKKLLPQPGGKPNGANKTGAEKTRKARKGKAKTVDFTINPNVVKCEEKTKLMLTFDKPLEEDEMESISITVSAKDQEDDSFDVTNKHITVHNPYTISFDVGAHRECNMELKVTWLLEGKDKKPINAVLGTQPLEYQTQTENLECANHFYLTILNIALATLLPSDNKEMLDKFDEGVSNALFSDQTDCEIPIKAFEQLFGMYEYSTYHGNSKVEMPTLLHISARYGLRKFVENLLQLNCAYLASSILNKDGHLASDIAGRHKHVELRESMETFQEMQDTYDLYETMQYYGGGGIAGASASVIPYYNVKGRPPGAMVTGTSPLSSSLPKDLNDGENDDYMPMKKALPGYLGMKGGKLITPGTAPPPVIDEEDYVYAGTDERGKNTPRPKASKFQHSMSLDSMSATEYKQYCRFGQSRFFSPNVPGSFRAYPKPGSQSLPRLMSYDTAMEQMDMEDEFDYEEVPAETDTAAWNKLTEIMDKVKGSEYNIHEACKLFESWKKEYPGCVIQNKKQIVEMKQVQNLAQHIAPEATPTAKPATVASAASTMPAKKEKEKGKGIFGKLFHRRGSKGANDQPNITLAATPNTKRFLKPQPVAPSAEDENRFSTSSTSSGGSRDSRGSVMSVSSSHGDSGVDINTPQYDVRIKRPGRNPLSSEAIKATASRISQRLDSRGLKPPEIPPRVPIPQAEASTSTSEEDEDDSDDDDDYEDSDDEPAALQSSIVGRPLPPSPQSPAPYVTATLPRPAPPPVASKPKPQTKPKPR